MLHKVRVCGAVVALGLGIVLAASSASAQTPSHAYELNNSLADTFGGPSLVNNGATLQATGLAFGVNEGPSLSSVFTSTTYSIEMQFRLDTTSGFRKLIDFKNRTVDTGLYNLDQNLNFYNTDLGADNVFADNVFAHLVVTRNGGSGTFSGYVDGVLQFSTTNPGTLSIFDGTDNIAHFFRDDSAVSGEASAGFVDYIRTYSTELTQTEVNVLFANRNSPLVVGAAPEPGSLALLLPAMAGGIALARRRRRN